MTLLAWSADRPDWQRDALRRIAGCERLSEEDRAAVGARLRHAHGIAILGDTACLPLAADHLPQDADDAAPTILCGIGPVRHLDRLAEGQELRFAVDGITLVFGDNGTGKSGYTRVAKKLCLARVIDELCGDVFAAQVSPAAQIQLRYRLPNGDEPQTEEWTDGEARPVALMRTMVLDSANARVYVDGQNEITYLPREIAIVAQLGELCTALGGEVQREADAIAQRCRAVYSAGYQAATRAGSLIGRLVLQTTLADLPTEAAMRAAATWNDMTEAELAELDVVLSQDPAAQAAARRRITVTLRAVAEEMDALCAALGPDRVRALFDSKASADAASDAAALSAAQVFADEPLAQTGRGAWEKMYGYARQFAAQAGIRAADETFQPGDPCPTCQQALDAEAADRLRRFDEFVRGSASAEATSARSAFETALRTRRELAVPTQSALQRSVAEYAGLGTNEAPLAQGVLDWFTAIRDRHAGILTAVENGDAASAATALPQSLSGNLRMEADRLEAEAVELEAQPARDPLRLAQQAELQDAKRLSEELDAVLSRRADLELRQRLLACKAAVDTRAISQFATRRRREPVTPELENGIRREIENLDLGHIPLRFEEASDHGRNFFDLALDTRQQAMKSRVLSEGEQRALGIACFLAEMSRIPGKHGIIVDDPVSSLDLQRLRKITGRLVDEAAAGRQVIIFTHHLVFYQEILVAAAARSPQVPAMVTLIGKRDGRFGIISENDEPWIAKKVTKRITALRECLQTYPANLHRDSEEHRRRVKDLYTDLRETWERLVEEILLNGVVERFCSGVKTQSLKGVVVEDGDYQKIFAAMARVSEISGHDMAAGRQLPAPDIADMRRELEAIDTYRTELQRRRDTSSTRRRALEEPPLARVI